MKIEDDTAMKGPCENCHQKKGLQLFTEISRFGRYLAISIDKINPNSDFLDIPLKLPMSTILSASVMARTTHPSLLQTEYELIGGV